MTRILYGFLMAASWAIEGSKKLPKVFTTGAMLVISAVQAISYFVKRLRRK